MTQSLVIGGGISGILAALLLKERGEDVCLVERNDSCGGLLRSWTSPAGLCFDYGTHVVQETGVPDIDRLLFDQIDERRWHTLRVLKTGNYYGGKLNEHSPFIDASRLPAAAYQQGLVELLCAAPAQAAPANAKETLDGHFGATYTREILAPVLQKLYGCGLDELHAAAHRLFGLTRLVALNPEVSRELKKIPLLDDRLAFHSYREGRSPLRHFYPKTGGIGEWIELLMGKMKAAGVKLLTGEQVRAIRAEGKNVRAVTLGGGEIECSRLVWTLPAGMFLAFAGADGASARPPLLRKTTLFHYVFDTPFLTDLHFFSCYESGMATFRVTLYSNIGREDAAPMHGPYRCTVEVLSGNDFDGEKALAELPGELARMGVVPVGARPSFAHRDTVAAGFPVLTNGYAMEAAHALTLAQAKFGNVVFTGKGQGGAFFVNDVLRETFESLAPRAT
ncbi:MAG: FAD-dependent oxidoreductase [Betaproteobacteria bacterium]|nr:FAD-dependent oxidoreductase [Betaproteobacteria bacterium]